MTRVALRHCSGMITARLDVCAEESSQRVMRWWLSCARCPRSTIDLLAILEPTSRAGLDRGGRTSSSRGERLMDTSNGCRGSIGEVRRSQGRCIVAANEILRRDCGEEGHQQDPIVIAWALIRSGAQTVCSSSGAPGGQCHGDVFGDWLPRRRPVPEVSRGCLRDAVPLVARVAVMRRTRQCDGATPAREMPERLGSTNIS